MNRLKAIVRKTPVLGPLAFVAWRYSSGLIRCVFRPSTLALADRCEFLEAENARLHTAADELRTYKCGGGRSFEEWERDETLPPPSVYSFQEIAHLADEGTEGTIVSPLVFIHVPKCAGTFVSNIFARNYRQRVDSFGEDFFMKMFPDEFYYYLTSAREKDTRLPLFFTGHFGLNNELFRRIANKYVCVTLLRDPVERLISHYNFHKNLPANDLNDAIEKEGIGVVEYAERYCGLDNRIPLQFHSFLDEENRTLNNAVNLAAEALRDEVTIFGFQESSDEFLVLLTYFLGLPVPFYRDRLNVTPEKDRVSESDRSALESLLQDDIEFYRIAQELYASRIETLSFDLQEATVRFREINDSFVELTSFGETIRGRMHPWTDQYS